MFTMTILEFQCSLKVINNLFKLCLQYYVERCIVSVLTTASLMEDGCMGHPGSSWIIRASTSTASIQIEYRPHDWQIPATQP